MLPVFNVLVLIKLIDCFNFDTNFPIVYKNPENVSIVDNYFGYTVGLYGGKSAFDSWVQISAPKEYGIDATYSSGAIYRCKIFGPCVRVKVEDGLTRVQGQRESRENQWLGVSMDVDVKSKRDVVCTHKVIWKPKYLIPGKCYWSHLDGNYERLKSLSDELPTKEILNNAYNYGMGQAGMSTHFTNTTHNETELLVGAPGVYNWHGTVILYTDRQDTYPQVSRVIYLDKLKRQAEREIDDLSNVNILSSHYFVDSLPFSLEGYSLCSGYFFNKAKLSYVTGAPAYSGSGRIIIFNVPYGHNTQVVKQGLQFGEYFGAALAAGDINNDGYDDIVIGAPFYANEHYNEGRIFVYLGDKNGILKLPSKGSRIEGKSIGGQFGNSIVFLQDIDLDGFNEVAVSSPYENDGSGVVYIFKCTENGIDPEASQRLIGKDANPSVKGFGISISKAFDVDGNKYRDIAIGAYKSSEVVLYRSRPVVVLKHRLKTLNYKINIDQTMFTINYCLSYNGQFLPATIRVKRTLVVDELYSRAFLSSANVTERRILKRGDIYCEDLNVTLKENIMNYGDPITIQLSQILDEYKVNKTIVTVRDNANIEDPFCKDCVFQDNRFSKTIRTLNIPFMLNCGADDKCESKLKISTTFTNLPRNSQYVIGSQDSIKFDIKLQNSGEKAFFVRVAVYLPENVNYKNTPSNCEQGTSNRYIICFLSSFILENEEKSLMLDLDMTDIKNVNGNILYFNVTSLTSSINLFPSSKIVQLSLIEEADITIVGNSNEQSYYINLQNDTKRFMQTIQIQKFGASPIDIIKVDFWIPTALKSGIGQFLSIYSLKGSQRNQPINCRSDVNYTKDVLEEYQSELMEEKLIDSLSNRTRRDVNTDSEVENELYPSNRTFYLNCTHPSVICSKISCAAGPFIDRQDDVNIILDMQFVSNQTYDMLGTKDIIVIAIEGNVTIESPINFKQFNDRPDNVTIQSIFIKEIPVKSTLWILILSIIIGFLLLLMVVGGLYKAGFFKRAKKEELEAMKRDEIIKSNDVVQEESVPDLQDDQIEAMIMNEGTTSM